MTRRMLINAQHAEELRIAIVDDDVLEDYQVEVAEQRQIRGNIYRGTIASIQPSLNAAFIEYGGERHGFLAIQDVVRQAWYKTPAGDKRPRIEEVLERGKPIVVQVSKESEGQKGAVLTTDLSLAGRYLVLTPFDDTRGISRKVEDDKTRKALRDTAKNLEVPDGCGFIVRTNAVGQTKTALSRDLNALLRLWKRIQTEARKGGNSKSSRLLYSDQDLVLQAFRDYLDNTVSEVLVDDDDAFVRAESYRKAFMPRTKIQLTRWQEPTPLFAKFKLEEQIGSIYDRRVELPSGGSIVIDRAEALTAIDVNSGRSTKASTQEETAVHTNLEAAREVARQLRLRDLGGLLVVDFIDMRAQRNRRKIEKALKDALKGDRARASVGRISSNGLLEINRQRIQQALQLRTHGLCPVCEGTGRIASADLIGLNLLRKIAGRLSTGRVGRVRVSLHPEIADAFQNQRRHQLAALEAEHGAQIEVRGVASMQRSEEEIECTERPRSEAPPRPEKKATFQASALLDEGSDDLDEDDLDDEEEDTDDEGGEGSGRRRRSSRGRSRNRRRKGRSRNGGRGSDPGDGADGDDQETSSRSARRSGKDGSEDDGDEGRSGRSRGRGRSRRRRGGDAGDTGDVGQGGADARGRDDGSSSDEGDEGESSQRSRRSRSRRRRGRRGDDDGGSENGRSSSAKDDGSSRDSDGGDDRGSGSDRSRSRSRRRSRDTGESEGGSDARSSSRSDSRSKGGDEGGEPASESSGTERRGRLKTTRRRRDEPGDDEGGSSSSERSSERRARSSRSRRSQGDDEGRSSEGRSEGRRSARSSGSDRGDRDGGRDGGRDSDRSSSRRSARSDGSGNGAAGNGAAGNGGAGNGAAGNGAAGNDEDGEGGSRRRPRRRRRRASEGGGSDD